LQSNSLIAKFPRRTETIDKTLKEWVTVLKSHNIGGEKAEINNPTMEKLRALGYVG
jgi:hypothetical protein